MDSKIAEALEKDMVIDITTVGRKSGEKRRIEIWFHYIDEQVYITGLPGKRSWYANMLANPEMTFHLKNSTKADIPATATPITAADSKRPILEKILENIERSEQIEAWVKDSPLVHVQLHLDG